MPSPSPGYAVTLRVRLDRASLTGDVAGAVVGTGAVLTALDVVESGPAGLVVDVTCDAVDAAHSTSIDAAVGALAGVSVGKVSDRTFLLHLGGKLEVVPTVPLKHRDDLSRAYTPGVARICRAIAENPADARRLTIKRNTVAIVTDGSAVLGLGDIGPAAALPVMEGKAALFKQFAGVDAWPVCIDSQDTDQIVEMVRALSSTYGGINLEDISAPRCFEIERRLRDLLDIPVFHDDQHGTAIVVMAALENALRVVGKTLPDVRIVVSGVGAAGHAIIRLLQVQGARNIVACDRKGTLHRGRAYPDDSRAWLAETTNHEQLDTSLPAALRDADVFIGVSGPDLLTGADIATMAPGAIVFALANPDPEVDPTAAARHAAVVATGRSDHPNQINNVLAFPGFFRGMLNGGASEITDAHLLAASAAIAAVVGADELNASYIVPSVFDPRVAAHVAETVEAAIHASRQEET